MPTQLPKIKTDTSVWTGIWAMEQRSLRALASNTQATPQQQDQQPYSVEGNTAIVPIVGPISKYSSVLQTVFGGVSTLDIQDQIARAMSNDAVEKIVLYIDSPGGMAAGTSDLAEYISAAKSVKPIIAYISDHCYSAAYWIASSCSKIIANQSAFVGSIGVYQVLTDTSKAAENAGVSLTLIAAGEYKGLKTPGLKIDPKAIEESCREVDAAYQLFTNAVSVGRNLPTTSVIPLADGRIHVASEALSLKLIDAIGTIDATIADTFEGVEMASNKEAEKKVDAPDDTDVDLLKQVLAAITALTQKIDEMSKDEEDEADDEGDTSDDAAAKAAAGERDRLKAIAAACGNRADYAMKAFLDGKSAIEAKAGLADVLSSENEKLRKKAAANSDGVEPLALAGPAVDPDTTDPEVIWSQNIGDIQKAYSGRKDFYLASVKHKMVKLAKGENK